MPTKKPMTTVVFDDDTFERIEDFRFNNRFPNRSQAVLFLVKAGMDALKDEYPELDLSIKLETGKNTENVRIGEERKNA